MIKQNVFDTVVNHARTQCKRAMNGPTCAYRSSDGSKCFVGVLIPDDKYNPLLEGGEVMGSFTYSTENMSLSSAGRKVFQLLTELLSPHDKDWDLLKDLQVTHDMYTIDQWESQFRRIAKQYELVYTPQE